MNVFWGTQAKVENVLYLYENTSAWNENNLSWSSHPSYNDDLIFDTIFNAPDTNIEHIWNATEIVKRQLLGDNFGFTYGPGTNKSVWATNAYSSESSKVNKRPKLTIYYHLNKVSSQLYENSEMSKSAVQNVQLDKSKMTLTVSKNDLYNISVYDISGKTLFAKKGLPLSIGSNSISLDVGIITTGVYFTVVENLGSQFYSKVSVK